MAILRGNGYGLTPAIPFRVENGSCMRAAMGLPGARTRSMHGEVLFPRHEIGWVQESCGWIEDVVRIPEACFPQDMS